MANVYTIDEDGSTEALERIHCKDEYKELQRILERNPDLLPGDQINPDDPRRWLPIKREMSVPDPCTGGSRWSVDLFLVDQEARPTFVECKRFKDTRARREVIGQVFEYAANAGHYLTKDQIRSYAEETAQQAGLSLEDAVRTLKGEEVELDEFFEAVEENLRKGQIRIVFFLEDSPMELRSIVEFLNKQMERSEVLLVEACQYACKNTKIVVPMLFGYTEDARRVKRIDTVTTGGARRKWDKESFFNEARMVLDSADLEIIRKLYTACEEMGCQFAWGTGIARGSFNPKHDAIGSRSFISVYTDGELILNFGFLKADETGRAFRDKLREAAISKLGLEVPEDCDRKFTHLTIGQWRHLSDKALSIFRKLIPEFTTAAT